MNTAKYIIFKSWAKMLLDKQLIDLAQYNALCAEIELSQKKSRKQ
jgi:hypothetical protein